MAIPKGEEESAGHTLVKITIEYEWKPHICLDCHVFGHTNDQCPIRFNNNKNLRYQPVKPKVNEPKQKQPSKEDRGKGIKTQNPFDQLAVQDENVRGTRIGNLVSKRRLLWAELGLHRQMVRGYPWILLGDFNVALNLKDILALLH
ncbi:reverse transcriptase domain-containing protein [Tanacetum coccineum]